MLTFMAQRLSSFFILKKIIKEEERAVYDYCFEVFLSTVINFMAIVILAFASRTVIPTIFFLVGFIGLRVTAGGFHAETPIGCFFDIDELIWYVSILTMGDTRFCHKHNGCHNLYHFIAAGGDIFACSGSQQTF